MYKFSSIATFLHTGLSSALRHTRLNISVEHCSCHVRRNKRYLQHVCLINKIWIRCSVDKKPLLLQRVIFEEIMWNKILIWQSFEKLSCLVDIGVVPNRKRRTINVLCIPWKGFIVFLKCGLLWLVLMTIHNALITPLGIRFGSHGDKRFVIIEATRSNEIADQSRITKLRLSIKSY